MQQALYHPEHGYYSSGRASIGRHGDYFTSVSVGPLFGQSLAAQFAQMWERLDQTDNFVIVEQGAHHGDFARDVLGSARKRWPEFFAALRYRIVEPFPSLQEPYRTLAEYEGKIEWRDSIDALEPFTGVHFSNELLDAMPVRLIRAAGLWPAPPLDRNGTKSLLRSMATTLHLSRNRLSIQLCARSSRSCLRDLPDTKPK